MLPGPSPKRIAAAVALALAAGAAAPAWAAGLGRLTVQSALGQPLRAEVEVTSLSAAEAATLNARLASADAFRQAGLDFNPALSNLRFAIDRRADGRTFVRITSPQAVNEPFVDLLVELNWANGRFVREYTFLLDPPELRLAGRDTVEGGNVVQSTVVPPVAASARAQTPAVQATPAPAPSGPAAAAPAPAAPASVPAARTAPAPAAALGTVEVRGGDTLAAIAGRIKPSEVSLDQALIAIYQANPAAFFGSVHQLRAGATLSIPDQQAMAAVDPSQAREQLRAHTRDFNAYRARLAERAPTVAAAAAGQSAEGRIGARIEDRGGASDTGDQLRLSRGTPEAAAGAGSAGSVATRAAEQGAARDAAAREAQSRVSELEKNVADLQQLVELKNRQLAELQKQVEGAGQIGQSAAGSIAPQAAAPAAAAAAASTGADGQPAAAADDGAASTPAQETSGAVQPAEREPAQDTEAKEAAAAPVAAARPAPAAPAPAPTSSLVDDVMSNPLVLPGLAAILALGAGYGWYSMRRRRKVEKFEDSLIAADGFATNSLFGSTGGQSVDTASSSVFTASTRDSGVDVHATEVDPIAEAEVYIAYGREAQAEEILREALKKQPERQAIRAKLLEILAGRRDTQGFAALAAEMYGQTGGQNEEWPKVVTMGLGLDPDNPLYTGGAPLPATDAPAPAGGGRPEGAVAGGTIAAAAAALGAAAIVSGSEPEATEPAAQTDESDSNAVDFSVLEDSPRGFVETQPLADDSLRPEAESEVPALDFDLDLDTAIGSIGAQAGAAQSAAQAGTGSELERAVGGRFELPSLDLDLGADEPRPAAQPAEARADGELALDDLDIDLPALESLTRTIVPGPAPAGGEVPEIDLSAIGLDLEPAPAMSGEEGERWQEMATKLDLASAYEEIGDKEGARELLDEVTKGGDADQQKKARAMLARIV